MIGPPPLYKLFPTRRSSDLFPFPLDKYKAVAIVFVKNHLFFIFKSSYSTQLPGTRYRKYWYSCYNRYLWAATLTSHGLRLSWDCSPPRVSPSRPHCVFPFCGAVTGRKYHYRLFRSLQAVCQNCFKDKFFSLCTFDVILLTDTLTICRWSWRIFLCAFPFGLNN